MKVVILSSFAQDVGCWLRAQYLGGSLNGCEVSYIKPFKKTWPFMLDMLFSLPVNFFRVLFAKADVMIAVKPFPNVTWPLLVKRLFGTKIIVDIDDLDHGYRKGIVSEISKMLIRPFPRYFDLVTYHNNNLLKHIVNDLKVDRNKTYRLDQGVDFGVFNHEIKDALLRNKFVGRKVLLYTGHLNIASDLDDILKAVSMLKERYVFIIAGGGPLENDFKKLAKELNVSVFFTGHLDRKDVARYLSIADVCLVYYKDNLVNLYRCSMKLRECLAMEKKVACNDVGDLKEFKDFTYQCGSDLKEFSKMIVKALNSKDKRNIKGRKYIENKYNWEKIGEKFSKQIHKLIK